MEPQEPDASEEQPPSPGLVGEYIARVNAERAARPPLTDEERLDRLDRWAVQREETRRERREAYVRPRQPEEERWTYIDAARDLGYSVTRLEEGWVFMWPDHRGEEHDFNAIFAPAVPVKVHPYSGHRVIQVWIGDDSDEERYGRTYQRILAELDPTGEGRFSVPQLSAWQDAVDRQLVIREHRIGGLLRDLASTLKVYVTEAAAQEQGHRALRWHQGQIESVDVHTVFEFRIVGAISLHGKVYKAGDEEAYLATNPRGIDLLRLADAGAIVHPPKERLPEGADHGWLLYLYRLHGAARQLWQGLSNGSASEWCYADAEEFFASYPASPLVIESARAAMHHFGEEVRVVLLQAQVLQDKRWALHTIAEAILLDRDIPGAAEAAAARAGADEAEGGALGRTSDDDTLRTTLIGWRSPPHDTAFKVYVAGLYDRLLSWPAARAQYHSDCDRLGIPAEARSASFERLVQGEGRRRLHDSE